MAHRYHEPIRVRVDERGQPMAFTWRKLTYEPLQVIGSWHLKDKWWEGTAVRQRSDRTYFRVQLPDCQVFEVYHDQADAWVLDVVQD